MDKSFLDPFRLTMAEQHFQVYGIRIETLEGDVVSHRWRSDDLVCLYSGSKTYVSMAIGICADEGRLKLSDKALDFFPEYRGHASENSEKIEVRDLLRMSSGIRVDTFGNFDKDTVMETDWAELFFMLPVECEPGTSFYYANPNTYLLGRIVEKVSGQNVRNYLLPRLFAPMGIDNPQWQTCPKGHPMGATGLYLTTDEYARLGSMMLHGGVYKDKQIVSAAYLDRAVHDTVDNCTFRPGEPESSSGYGYQIWRCAHPGAFRADGMYGQFSIVVPDKKVTVTLTSHQERATGDLIRAVFEDIVHRL